LCSHLDEEDDQANYRLYPRRPRCVLYINLSACSFHVSKHKKTKFQIPGNNNKTRIFVLGRREEKPSTYKPLRRSVNPANISAHMVQDRAVWKAEARGGGEV
jgi:hypothetical protein